ncbi:MAG: hypothetical protein KDK97_02330 [Verrucomicrobiales bacterium]|nr:hypothetical protein [Verrucomicrobiales bacterium]MCP5558997.1 hypothetical protein [Verrucomicrobiaceae bacterium]
MTFTKSQALVFRKILGIGLLALALLGAVSLAMKDVPLALFGVHTTGIVKKVEVIQTSTSSKWERDGFGPKKAVSRSSHTTLMHMGFTTKEGREMLVKTTATFNTEAKVGDEHPMIYLSSKPETAKIYSAKQLWLPMGIGFIFVMVCGTIGFFFLKNSSRQAA